MNQEHELLVKYGLIIVAFLQTLHSNKVKDSLQEDLVDKPTAPLFEL